MNQLHFSYRQDTGPRWTGLININLYAHNFLIPKIPTQQSILQMTSWLPTPLYEQGSKLPILRLVIFPTREGTAETRANRYALKKRHRILLIKDQFRKKSWGRIETNSRGPSQQSDPNFKSEVGRIDVRKIFSKVTPHNRRKQHSAKAIAVAENDALSPQIASKGSLHLLVERLSKNNLLANRRFRYIELVSVPLSSLIAPSTLQ